jgi:hypothetical protein
MVGITPKSEFPPIVNNGGEVFDVFYVTQGVNVVDMKEQSKCVKDMNLLVTIRQEGF